MHSELPELMPSAAIADVLRKEDGDLIGKPLVFCQGPREKARTGGVQNVEFRPKQARYTLHHGSYPSGLVLRFNAILDNGFQKGMPSRSPEGIIANFPVHSILPAQVAAERQLFKGKHTGTWQEFLQPGSQKHIKVQVETTKSKYREIPKEIILLDAEGKASKDFLVLRKLVLHESSDLIVIKKEIFEIRIQALET
jgi:hypothetical protein